jgi:hypothetical protein
MRDHQIALYFKVFYLFKKRSFCCCCRDDGANAGQSSAARAAQSVGKVAVGLLDLASVPLPTGQAPSPSDQQTELDDQEGKHKSKKKKKKKKKKKHWEEDFADQEVCLYRKYIYLKKKICVLFF